MTDATRRIKKECVPEFATYLDALKIQWDDVWSDGTEYKQLKKILRIVGVDSIHKYKLNIRHMGYVRKETKSVHVKKLILTMCVARVAKDDFKTMLRLKMLESQDQSRSLHKVSLSSFITPDNICIGQTILYVYINLIYHSRYLPSAINYWDFLVNLMIIGKQLSDLAYVINLERIC